MATLIWEGHVMDKELKELKSVVEAGNPIDWATYSRLAPIFSLYPPDSIREAVTTGIIAELGELCGVINKRLRKDDFDFEDLLKKELGDVFWYLALGKVNRINVIWPRDYVDSHLLDYEGNGITLFTINVDLEALVEKYGFTLGDVLITNLTKLYNRFTNNTIRGSGDYR